jgi:signal transduction histidine kinase
MAKGAAESDERRSRDLELLLEASRELSSSLALHEVLDRISHQILEVVPAWRVGVLLTESDERYLRLAASVSRGEGTAEAATGRLLEIDRYPEVREALRTRSAVHVEDVATHSLMSGVRDPVGAAGLRSLLAIPLVAGEDALGVLSLAGRTDQEAMTPRHLSLLRAVANQSAIAIGNARLYGELQAAARELEFKVQERTRRLEESHLRLSILNDITTAINMALDRDELVARSLASLQRLEAFERVQLYMNADHEPGWVVAFGLGPGDSLRSSKTELPAGGDEGAAGVLELSGRPAELPGPGRPEDAEPPRSHLIAPLVSKDGIIGALQAFSSVPDAFSAADEGLLQQVAGEISIALERSVLYAAERRRSRQFQVISDIGRQLTGAIAAENLLPTAAELVRRSLGYARVAVLLLDERSGELRVAGADATDPELAERLRQHHQDADAGLCGKAFRTGLPVLVHDVAAEPDYLAGQELPTGSEMAVPISVAGTTLGVLDLQSERRRAFDEEDVAAARTIADQLAAALNLSQLLSDLQQEREFSTRIINNLTGGLLVTDRKRRVLVVNASGAEMLRCSAEELLDRDLLEVFPTAAPLFDYSDEAIGRDCEVELADGETVPIGYSNAFFVDSDAGRAAVIITFRDLSDLRALQRKVREAERLATIGKVAAGVAHEIRNPLFGISATAQVIAGEFTDDTAIADLCQSMLDEVKRLDRLIESLLKYGRPQELLRQPVDPCELWSETLEACTGRAQEAGTRLEHACAPSGRQLEVDRDQLKQVLLNLVLNAIDATGEGCVRVTTDWDSQEGAVLLTVDDEGPGLEPELRDQIFDLFFTTKSKGSGMGLAISRKIAEDHGGSLSAAVRPGGGARFVLTLPLAEPSS